MDQWHGDREQEKNIREIKIHIYAKRQTLICTAWPSFPLKCHLLLITFTHKKSSLMPVWSIRIVSGQFLSAYFLFWEILNLNLLFAVNVTVNLSNMEKERKTLFCSHSLPHPPHCFFFSDLIDLSPQSECLEQDTIRLVSVHCKMKRANSAPKMGPKRVSPERYCFWGQFSPIEMGLFWYQNLGLIWPLHQGQIRPCKGPIWKTLGPLWIFQEPKQPLKFWPS